MAPRDNARVLGALGATRVGCLPRGRWSVSYRRTRPEEWLVCSVLLLLGLVCAVRAADGGTAHAGVAAQHTRGLPHLRAKYVATSAPHAGRGLAAAGVGSGSLATSTSGTGHAGLAADAASGVAGAPDIATAAGALDSVAPDVSATGATLLGAGGEPGPAEPVLEPSEEEVAVISKLPTAPSGRWYTLSRLLKDCKYWSVSLTTVASPVTPVTSENVTSHVIMSPDIIARTHPEVWWNNRFLLSADPFLYRHWDDSLHAWRWYLFFEVIENNIPALAWARQQADDPLLEREFEYGGVVGGMEGLEPNCGFSYPYIFRGDPGPDIVTESASGSGVPSSVPSASAASASTDGSEGEGRSEGVSAASSGSVAVDGAGAGPAYMLPSSSCRGDPLKLYVAKVFPDVWHPVATLVQCHPKCGDSDIIKWNGHWYLFVGTNNNKDKGSGHVRTLFVSQHLRGPYHKHPQSPLKLMSKSFGRGAGRMVPWGTKYITRYSQHYVNGEHRYGDYVVASLIDELTPTTFSARYSADWMINRPRQHRPGKHNATAWDMEGTHHVDMHPLHNGTWLAAFDGREACGVTKSRAFHVCWQRRHKKKAKLAKNEAANAACRNLCELLSVPHEHQVELEGGVDGASGLPLPCTDGSFAPPKRQLRAHT